MRKPREKTHPGTQELQDLVAIANEAHRHQMGNIVWMSWDGDRSLHVLIHIAMILQFHLVLESIRFEHNNLLQTHTSHSVVRVEKRAETRIQYGCKTEIVLVVEVMVGAHVER